MMIKFADELLYARIWNTQSPRQSKGRGDFVPLNQQPPFMATGASASDKMDPNAEKEYEDFLKKVKRTIFIDNLSPKVTGPILRNALAQYGTVKSVQFVPHYTETASIPDAALVEMENPQQAETITQSVVSENLYMVLGIPKPVNARPAVPEMFADRPPKPGRRIMMRWLDPKDPDFKVAQEIKSVVKRHAAEDAFLLQEALYAEKELARRQSVALKANEEKYNLAVAASTEKTINTLNEKYNKGAGSSKD